MHTYIHTYREREREREREQIGKIALPDVPLGNFR
jgi:hypothetical protein